MKFKKSVYLIMVSIVIFMMASCANESEFLIENESLSRTLKITDGKLHTVHIFNKLSGTKITPGDKQEFKIRISQGTHREGTDVELTSEDFTFVKVLHHESSALAFLLENTTHELQLEIYYKLEKDDFYMRKHMKIKSDKTVTLERIDVEAIVVEDIYQPYQAKQITAQGVAEWRPGLGQPLYASQSATFWGMEFPAAYNFVDAKRGHCGYLWGKEIRAGEVYTSYKSVVGVGDDSEFIQDAFFEYIDQIRVRPLRLQVQYNSWFDFYSGVDREKFVKSVSTVHQNLVDKRGVAPLSAYVIDDGWQDTNADWSDKTWKVNQKFDTNFKSSKEQVALANSKLGLWMSPGCLLGAEPAVPKYKEQGFEVLDKWMSLAGPKYMQLLEDRILELTENGVAYFKLDGLFGHLNTREFELHGDRYGIPHMPQLGTADLSPSDPILNDHKFDELKTYYLVAGTERLMEIFKKQHEVDPNVYVVISNGAFLSPWWLMYIDAVWMINAGDAANGSNRTEELVYRDGVYYDTWQEENTQFPINSVFNHEPKKIKTGETQEAFSEYLWMNLSRGTGFIELYIKTQQLSEADWDVLANGLKWAQKSFPYFKRTRMHGGNPKKSEVYGYSGWNEDGGFISFHNPSNESKKYGVKLDRKLGVLSQKETYKTATPLSNASEYVGKTYAYGSELEVSLEPGEVKILDFK
ncbi:hypothetical protein [uncultured Kriegella sp.]|uniref:hypothetical protein n=1 Tax=uncultured Kriegella sp. TaxID=1798910 RepID=UPI0030DC825E